METNQIELITRLVMEAMEKEPAGNGFMVPVGVSARHIHLTQEHVEILFGPGYHLTKKGSHGRAVRCQRAGDHSWA